MRDYFYLYIHQNELGMILTAKFSLYYHQILIDNLYSVLFEWEYQHTSYNRLRCLYSMNAQQRDEFLFTNDKNAS